MTTLPQGTIGEDKKPRTICLCFDGTGNKFGQNSNVVRFFRALKKDNLDSQLAYYQAGIGTYNKRQFRTKTISILASALDQAVALHLNDHVKEGYHYLMQNYRPGDKICLFGFSRGAYTARSLAGMLYKVGLLPPHNDQQVDFAFTVYQATDRQSAKTSQEFKSTFATPVEIEFLGVWDTVSSVGIIPRHLPYSSVTLGVKTFRHALALDEHRARFRPSVWAEPKTGAKEELMRDVVIPERGETSRDDWVYDPPASVDVKEVWFSGCHADIGGGSHRTTERDSLSGLPLRWMIKECITAKAGLVFDEKYLKALGLNIDGSSIKIKTQATKSNEQVVAVVRPEEPIRSAIGLATGFAAHLVNSVGFSAFIPHWMAPAAAQAKEHHTVARTLIDHAKDRQDKIIDLITKDHRDKIIDLITRDRRDVVAKIYDQLKLTAHWWALEFIPMGSTYQLPNGTWWRVRRSNIGRGRMIPSRDGVVYVHDSVRLRMELKKENKNEEYTPLAANWDYIVDNKLVRWVPVDT